MQEAETRMSSVRPAFPPMKLGQPLKNRNEEERFRLRVGHNQFQIPGEETFQ